MPITSNCQTTVKHAMEWDGVDSWVKSRIQRITLGGNLNRVATTFYFSWGKKWAYCTVWGCFGSRPTSHSRSSMWNQCEQSTSPSFPPSTFVFIWLACYVAEERAAWGNATSSGLLTQVCDSGRVVEYGWRNGEGWASIREGCRRGINVLFIIFLRDQDLKW